MDISRSGSVQLSVPALEMGFFSSFFVDPVCYSAARQACTHTRGDLRAGQKQVSINSARCSYVHVYKYVRALRTCSSPVCGFVAFFAPGGGRHAAAVSAGLKACPVHEKEARGRALTVVSCMEKDMGKRSISSWLSYGSKELVLSCRGDLGTASPATYLPTYQSNSAHVLIGDYHVSQQALPSLFHLTYINRNAPLFSPRAATALLRGPAV